MILPKWRHPISHPQPPGLASSPSSVHTSCRPHGVLLVPKVRETAQVRFHPTTRYCSRRLPNLSPESSLGRVGPITLLDTRSLQDVDALRKRTQRSLGDALWLFEAHCQGMCLSSCVGFSTQDPTPFYTFKTSVGPLGAQRPSSPAGMGPLLLVFSTQTCKGHISYTIGD